MTITVDNLLSGPGYASFQSDDDRRRELGQDIVAAAYLRGDFVLSSGARSSYYFDKYMFEFMGRRVPDDVARLAGPELGAVALAAVVSLETGLPFVVVRKVAKKYATTSSIEGELHAGERVLIIEDVVSSGGEALAAAQKVRAAGAVVVGVLAVIDRQSAPKLSPQPASHSTRCSVSTS
jgi:orotate phosphoribosyltransferase